jgi:RNA polymerase sigma-70 factor, ECF subfamily
MWAPGRIPAGTETDALASTIDLLPTIAALTGTPLPADRAIDGVDISALLTGDAEVPAQGIPLLQPRTSRRHPPGRLETAGEMSKESDFQIDVVIAAVRRGETDKFRLIVREYGLLVRGYLAARLSHQDDADDLAQEVFLIAFDKLGAFVPGHFGAWLIGIARNQLRNHWRSGARRADAIERFREEVSQHVEPEIDAATAAFTPDEIDRLLHCISLLPDRLRRIVRAGLEGTRTPLLAEELGLNLNALYQARFRAHALLRKCMKQATPPPAA